MLRRDNASGSGLLGPALQVARAGEVAQHGDAAAAPVFMCTAARNRREQ